MKRLFAFIVGNWPLKLGAVALATVLYGGVVLSENTRTLPGQVPINVLNPPPNAAVLDVLPYVTGIQYRAPIDQPVSTDCFTAHVDLSNVRPELGGSATEVPVQLIAICGRIQIVDYTPQVVNVRVDPVVTRQLPVTVDHGVVPEGLNIGPPQVDPPYVSVTGAGTRVASVHTVTARVTIDASGLNVDQEVDVEALDDTGTRVPGIALSPSRVHIRINVSRQLANATLPVIPQFTGTVADGYQVSRVTVDPVSVTVSGEAPAVERLSGANTVPIDLSGISASFETDAALDLPPQITVDGPLTVRVSVAITVSPASRTFEVGVDPTGMIPVYQYDIARSSVLVTVAGPAPFVDALDVTDIHATLELGKLGFGAHEVPVIVAVPSGVTETSVDPSLVTVTVTPAVHLTPQPSPTPTPVPTPTPALPVLPTAVPTPGGPP